MSAPETAGARRGTPPSKTNGRGARQNQKGEYGKKIKVTVSREQLGLNSIPVPTAKPPD